MRRFFALYVGVILLAAGTGYGSIASNYNHDIAAYPATLLNNNWVLVQNPNNGLNWIYKLNGRTIEAGIIWAPVGSYFSDAQAWNCLYNNCDRAGQSWRVYARDRAGNPEFCTSDGRLFAKLYWLNGSHTLRVCYATFLTKTGQWRYDGNVPSHRSTRSKPKKAAPKELLPPIEES